MASVVANAHTLTKDHLADEWPAAKRVIDAALDATGFGPGLGWNLTIKLGHRHKQAKKDGLLVVDEDGLHRRVLVRTRAANSWIHYDVWVSWKKAEVPVAEVARSLRAASQRLKGWDDGGPDEPTAERSSDPVVLPASPAVPDLDAKLLKMQSGIGRLIELNRDMKAVAQLKAEAEKRHQAAASAVAEPQLVKDRLAGRLVELNDEYAALARQATDLEAQASAIADKLARTRAEMDKVQGQAAVVRTDLAAARTAHDPLAAELAAALATLREVEAAERERAESLAKAGDLSVLLTALERLG